MFDVLDSEGLTHLHASDPALPSSLSEMVMVDQTNGEKGNQQIATYFALSANAVTFANPRESSAVSSCRSYQARRERSTHPHCLARQNLASRINMSSKSSKSSKCVFSLSPLPYILQQRIAALVLGNDQLVPRMGRPILRTQSAYALRSALFSPRLAGLCLTVFALSRPSPVRPSLDF